MPPHHGTVWRATAPLSGAGFVLVAARTDRCCLVVLTVRWHVGSNHLTVASPLVQRGDWPVMHARPVLQMVAPLCTVLSLAPAPLRLPGAAPDFARAATSFCTLVAARSHGMVTYAAPVAVCLSACTALGTDLMRVIGVFYLGGSLTATSLLAPGLHPPAGSHWLARPESRRF